MKFNGILLLIFGLIQSCHCQTNQVETDKILLQLKTEIQADWNFQKANSDLMIESKTDVWIDFYNSAGVPHDDPELKKFTPEYLQEKGRKTKLLVRFRLEEKWSEAKKQSVIGFNRKIEKEIQGLLEKHKISHVKRSSRYGEELFWGASPEEKVRIENYRKEKEKLIKTKIILPDYNSENYSFFVVYKTWNYSTEGAYHMLPMIYPKEAETKILELEKVIEKVLIPF